MTTSTDTAHTVERVEVAKDSFRYERLFVLLLGRIDGGALMPGDRLPSVRQLARERGVSVSTVLEAYRRLEDRGRIEARPRAGFFVRPRPTLVPIPKVSQPETSPQVVRTSDLIRHVADAARRQDVVPLGAAYPAADLLPTARLGRLAAAAVRKGDGISAWDLDPLGDLALRRQIARLGLFANRKLDLDDIVVTQGASEALVLALRAVTRPGDAVAVESPTYFGLLQLLAALDLRAVELPTNAQHGVEIAALEPQLRRGSVAAAVLVPHFQNPLGACMTDEAKLQVARLARRHRIPVIEDDVFGDLPYDGPRPASLARAEAHGWVMSCSSFSKTLAPGYRLGWLAPGRFRDRVVRAKASLRIGAPIPMQRALAHYLAEGGFARHLTRLRRICRDSMGHLRAAIATSFPQGTRVTDPQGGFVVWVELPPNQHGKRPDAIALHQSALEQGISVAPGPIFTANARARHFIRLSCGQPWSDRLASAVGQLGRLVREQTSGPTRDTS